MFKKKKQLYFEIIDLQSELNEYRKLCKNKSKKYTYYLDWKKHISDKLAKLDSHDKIENFKHYLINYNRVSHNITSYYITLMIFSLNFYFSKIDTKLNTLSLIISIIIIVSAMIYDSDFYNKEYCFYCDLIEIIEEKEKTMGDEK